MLFNEPKLLKSRSPAFVETDALRFSALQRAEIAEIEARRLIEALRYGFSALQRAEIAEIALKRSLAAHAAWFQCSSTSRNC